MENKDLKENMSDLHIPGGDLIPSDISETKPKNHETEIKDSENSVVVHRVHRISTASTRRSRPLVAKFKHSKQEESIRDVQQMRVINELSLVWSPSLNQMNSESSNMKEKWEGPWITKEGDQLGGVQQAEVNKFPFIAVPMKSEDDEDESLLPQLHQSEVEGHRDTVQIKIESDGEDCEGLEPARKQDPDSHQQPKTNELLSDSSETDNSDDWQEPLLDSGPETEGSDSSWNEVIAPKSALNAINNKEAPKSNVPSNSGKKTYISFECSKDFQVKEYLQEHTIFHSEKPSSREKPFGCAVCGKGFHVKSNVKRHMRVHTGEQYECDVCEKSFNSKSNLNRHMTVHTGEKPYGCDVCGKGFVSMYDLKVHRNIHEEENSYGCDVCGKRFICKASFKRHLTVHTGEKPYGCDMCGKMFNRKSNLKAHQIIHTGEKPYVCDICEKRFNTKSNLKKHIKVHKG